MSRQYRNSDFKEEVNKNFVKLKSELEALEIDCTDLVDNRYDIKLYNVEFLDQLEDEGIKIPGISLEEFSQQAWEFNQIQLEDYYKASQPLRNDIENVLAKSAKKQSLYDMALQLLVSGTRHVLDKAAPFGIYNVGLRDPQSTPAQSDRQAKSSYKTESGHQAESGHQEKSKHQAESSHPVKSSYSVKFSEGSINSMQSNLTQDDPVIFFQELDEVAEEIAKKMISSDPAAYGAPSRSAQKSFDELFEEFKSRIFPNYDPQHGSAIVIDEEKIIKYLKKCLRTLIAQGEGDLIMSAMASVEDGGVKRLDLYDVRVTPISYGDGKLFSNDAEDGPVCEANYFSYYNAEDRLLISLPFDVPEAIDASIILHELRHRKQFIDRDFPERNYAINCLNKVVNIKDRILVCIILDKEGGEVCKKLDDYAQQYDNRAIVERKILRDNFASPFAKQINENFSKAIPHAGVDFFQLSMSEVNGLNVYSLDSYFSLSRQTMVKATENQKRLFNMVYSIAKQENVITASTSHRSDLINSDEGLVNIFHSNRERFFRDLVVAASEYEAHISGALPRPMVEWLCGERKSQVDNPDFIEMLNRDEVAVLFPISSDTANRWSSEHRIELNPETIIAGRDTQASAISKQKPSREK